MEFCANEYDIVVIDSGSNLVGSEGITVVNMNNDYSYKSGCEDYIGHGTAINYILQKVMRKFIISTLLMKQRMWT